jgi:hypothetical protein
MRGGRKMLRKYKLVVLTNATEGNDQEFDDWYDNVHIPEVLDTPGFVGAERFKFRAGDARWKYLAIYEIEAESADEALETLNGRALSGAMQLTDALDETTLFHGVFE